MAQRTKAEPLEFSRRRNRPPLRIEVATGRSNHLVVCFSSVGTNRHGWPPREFVALASQNGENHIMSVSDISRSWMNGEGIDELLQQHISDYVLEHEIRTVSSIGTSMGAYCALLLGRMMPLVRILAFSPQYSVHPDIMPDETRWLWFRQRISSWPYPALDTLPAAPTQLYVFHGDDALEQMHWSRFLCPKNLQHFIFQDADHGIVRKLKSVKALHKVVRAAFEDDRASLKRAVKSLGGMSRKDYEDYIATGTYRPAHLSGGMAS